MTRMRIGARASLLTLLVAFGCGDDTTGASGGGGTGTTGSTSGSATTGASSSTADASSGDASSSSDAASSTSSGEHPACGAPTCNDRLRLSGSLGEQAVDHVACDVTGTNADPGEGDSWLRLVILGPDVFGEQTDFLFLGAGTGDFFLQTDALRAGVVRSSGCLASEPAAFCLGDGSTYDNNVPGFDGRDLRRLASCPAGTGDETFSLVIDVDNDECTVSGTLGGRSFDGCIGFLPDDDTFRTWLLADGEQWPLVAVGERLELFDDAAVDELYLIEPDASAVHAFCAGSGSVLGSGNQGEATLEAQGLSERGTCTSSDGGSDGAVLLAAD